MILLYTTINIILWRNHLIRQQNHMKKEER